MRVGTAKPKRDGLAADGVEVREVSFESGASLQAACTGAACVVSTLSGLDDVILDTQGHLLDVTGIPRFIPSDFSLDYTYLTPGTNRNFDLRRRFRARVDAAPIRATSIFNGFADMLAGQMPLIVRPIRRVLYWESPDRTFPLTTRDNTAAVTAAAALDPDAPRDIHAAGGTASARSLAETMSRITGHDYRPLRFGSLRSLEQLIRIVQRLAPQQGSVFPAWQAMQYLQNMFSGRAPSGPDDNGRYGGIAWTSVEDVLRSWPR